MFKQSWIFRAVCLVCILGLQANSEAQQVSKDGTLPNIVFILADDLGYGELGCYGQEKIKTPHIDRLAREGMRLTQHYSGASVCAPARCVLMTGRQLPRAEIRGNADSGRGGPFPGQWPLSAEAVTIAKLLSARGYRTGGFGKWGLGPTDSSGSPLRQGFDRFFGYNCQRNAHSYFPSYLDDDEGVVVINPKPIPAHQKQLEGDVLAENYRGEVYAPDAILEQALAFISQDSDREQPFFLYLPFVEPHLAMHPPQAWVERYPEAWDEGYGPYRGENGYLPHPRPRAAYAAMISHLDDHVGRIIEALEQKGILDNTLVVFTSDNGPTHLGNDRRFFVGGVDCDFFNSNGGLRGYKGSCYEGGIRVPCIVRWPSQVVSGSESNFVSGFCDWLPTLCQTAGIDDSEIEHDGISLLSVFAKMETPARNIPLMWDTPEYGGFVAIREGNFKAIRSGVNRPQANSWELYDLENDPSETTDLAAHHPETVERLEKFFIEHRTVSEKFPNKIYDPQSPASD